MSRTNDPVPVGHRKIAAMMRVDGHEVSTSTVERALRRRGPGDD